MIRGLALAAALLTPAVASAATLTGDTLSFVVNPNVFAADYTVGAGIDGTAGAFNFDFDAGAAGDQFLWTNNGPVGSNTSLGGGTSLTLSGLDFSGNAVLVGFNLSFTLFSNLTFAITGTSITFSWDPIADVVQGDVLTGSFVTVPAAIPLPAGGVLLLTGLAALGLSRRRAAV